MADITTTVERPFSIFICYRHEEACRAVVEEVSRVLRRDDRTVAMDDSFADSMADFDVQAFGHIEDDDVVVVVLPTDHEWLTTLSDLVKLSATEKIPNLAKELLEVKKRIIRNKSVAVVLMQEQQSDGRWQPGISELPPFLSHLPTLVPMSDANWRETLSAHVIRWQTSRNNSAAKRGGGVTKLQLELANALIEWNSGRIGTRGDSERGEDDWRDCDFRYDSSLYVALDATVIRRLPALAKRAEPLPESIDPVVWIRDESTTYGWLLGDAGSGKTITLTRAAAESANVAIDWLQKEAASPTPEVSSPHADHAPRIPIVLSCPRFYRPPGNDPTPLDISPQGIATRMAASREQQFDDLDGAWSRFLALLRSHKCLLLLDGIDAIDDENAADHINKSIQFLRQFVSDVRIVVAAGPHHVASVPGDAAVVRINPLDSPRRTALVENFIALRPDQDGGKRVRQTVGSLLQDARTGEHLAVLDTPLWLTLACGLAVENSFEQVERLSNDILERVLERASTRHGGLTRNELRRLAFAVAKRPRRVLTLEDALVAVESDPTKRSRRQRRFESELRRQADVVLLDPKPNVKLVWFPRSQFLYRLAAEQCAELEMPALLTELDDAFGWQRIAEFVPGAVNRRDGTDAACRLLELMRDLARTRRLEAPDIWLAGLHAIVNSEALRVLPFASAFAVQAKEAVTCASNAWELKKRAIVLDACGLVARQRLDVLFDFGWVLVPELSSPRQSVEVASSPVLVAEFAEFLNAPDIEHKEAWPAGQALSLLASKNEGEWYQQLRAPLRPVTGVTWYEATAYCGWRTAAEADAQERYEYRLPTPDEWRIIGSPGGHTPGQRVYPWEMHEFVARNSLGGPSPVGLVPPYCRPALYDFGANVFEWSRYPVRTIERDVEVMGGCWSDVEEHMRIDRPAIFRPPESRRLDTGFRCLRVNRVRP